MPSRNIELTEKLSDLVSSFVESGRYDSAEDVVGEALHLLSDQETADEATKVARLRAEIQIGLDDLEAGRYTEFESVEALVDDLKRHGDAIISGKFDK